MTPAEKSPARSRAHLAEAFRWTHEPIAPFDLVAAALAMAAPVLAGALLGHLSAGFLAALGAITLASPVVVPDVATHIRRLGAIIATVGAATCAAVLASGHGAAIVALATLAALAGGYSRPLAEATTRFILLLVIVASALDAHAGARAGFLALVLAGALWAACVALALGALSRALAPTPPARDEAQRPVSTTQQKFARWRGTLKHWRGWSFALRLAACLSCAYLLHALWPGHHLPWIAVTAAILLQRQAEPFPVRTTQRALGVAAGLCLASLLLAGEPPLALLVAGIALMAGLRPLLRVKNYLAYSAIMTPLIVLMIDSGAPPTWGLLRDRLVATMIGAGLVLTANAIALRREAADA